MDAVDLDKILDDFEEEDLHGSQLEDITDYNSLVPNTSDVEPASSVLFSVEDEKCHHVNRFERQSCSQIKKSTVYVDSNTNIDRHTKLKERTDDPWNFKQEEEITESIQTGTVCSINSLLDGHIAEDNAMKPQHLQDQCRSFNANVQDVPDCTVLDQTKEVQQYDKDLQSISKLQVMKDEDNPSGLTLKAMTLKSCFGEDSENNQILLTKSEVALDFAQNDIMVDSVPDIIMETGDFGQLEMEALSEVEEVQSEIKKLIGINTDIHTSAESSYKTKQVTQCFSGMPVNCSNDKESQRYNIQTNSNSTNLHCLENIGETKSMVLKIPVKERCTSEHTPVKPTDQSNESGISECHSLTSDNNCDIVNLGLHERPQTSEINPHYLTSLQRPGILPSNEHNNVDKKEYVSESMQPAVTNVSFSTQGSSGQTETVSQDFTHSRNGATEDVNIKQVPFENPTFHHGEYSGEDDERNDCVPSETTTENLGLLEAPPGLICPKEGSLQPPPSTSYPSISITDLGAVSPTWMPDATAPNCLQCNVRFSFTRRRHHCRACGKVFCSACCNMKSRLTYMGEKEARVCSVCYQDLIRAQVYNLMGETCHTSANENNFRRSSIDSANDGCFTDDTVNDPKLPASSTEQKVKTGSSFRDGSSSHSGVLHKQAEDKTSSLNAEREAKQVTFCDGTRPGYSNISAVVKKISNMTNTDICHFIPSRGLPPLVTSNREPEDWSTDTSVDSGQTMQHLTKGNEVSFGVNCNLQVTVKMVHLDCCLNCSCLVFTSKGLCTVGQAEVIIVLESLPGDTTIPVDIFRQYEYFYENSIKGNLFHDMGYIECFNQSRRLLSDEQSNLFLDSSENGGFLFICPTSQCLRKLTDEKQYIFAILLQKWEVPWAKAFPLRLMLRLGAEFRYYPCPLVSQRNRSPVFSEIGHTIMNMLIDFESYSYTLPVIDGFTIEMQNEQIVLTFRRDRYEDFLRVLHCGSEHVFAIGAAFNAQADAYLVCVQKEDGDYHTEAINLKNKVTQVTGATFVIFSGSLKTSSEDYKCKSSIVEDGLMIQLIPSLLDDVKSAITNMTDLTIQCTKTTANERTEELTIRWEDCKQQYGIQLVSQVDGKDQENMKRVPIQNFRDYCCEKKALRLTELYYKKSQDDCSQPEDIIYLAELLAQATCEALAPVLQDITKLSLEKIGLRANIDTDNITYECGANGKGLPDYCTEFLDANLIPVIHAASSKQRGATIILELVFHIVNL